VTALSDEELSAVEEITGSGTVASEVVWERPHVVRVSLKDGRSVITKRPRQNRDTGAVGAPEREAFERERAVLELLADVFDSPAPHLVGAAGDLLVMEDLPPGRSLAELLLGADEDAARAGIVSFAGALGQMHASAVGMEGRFGVLRQPPDRSMVTDKAVAGFVTLADRFRSDVASGRLADDAHAVADDLRADGWWRTLIHGDPCPDNTRIEDGQSGRFRIFDFEHASFGSCVLDASYVVAPFPSCWCFGRIPDDISAGAVAEYRRVLGEVRPQALDDRAWDGALTTALAAWVVARGQMVLTLLDADSDWGTTTVRVRVRRWLDAFLAAAHRSDRYPALRAVCTTLSEELAKAWPDAVLGDYPSLPTGASTVVDVPAFWRPGL
jgi:hypothetical protein